MNIQRDSYASYDGHYPMLAYFAIAENESIGRERYTFMQVLFQLLCYLLYNLCFSMNFESGLLLPFMLLMNFAV